ncbi:Cys3 cystathionine gamma-lyase [Rhizoctonia solani AG-3 Rhs1AP]|uniref:cystathionine gamma-lyase n=1 Tax=Rhizoctonia solani AG-3 Rhs1AP TaxID=1086054 RepID=X8IZT3_9AGAM|nr:Cys3 cystathionine gamma-lyase [Rhizoctonia solani AG-3 Rhs1AP]
MHSTTAGFGTRAVHVGAEPNAETGAVIAPITLSTTYKQDAVGVNKGYDYSRCGNPNRAQLERLLASIEAGGGNAVAFASGTATTTNVLQALGYNAHIVSMNDVYGGTYTCMTRVAKEIQGLETTFVDLDNGSDEEITASFRENTKLIWIESPTNPTLRIVDIQRIVRLARAHPSNPLVLVDNTFLSPFYSSPLLLGADAVVHSLTKYINGHSDVLMGALIVPPESTHPRAAAFAERARFLQNAAGAIPSPHDCWLAHRGAKTLHLRMQAHGRNALKVASFMKSISGPESAVESVTYPGLVAHPRHELAVKQLSPHAKKFVDTLPAEETSAGVPFGGMISFRIKGGLETAEAFLAHSQYFTLAVSLGGVESLAQIPARMTHGAIPEEERNALGITSNLVRLSIGIEDADDLIADIQQALDATLPHLASKSNGGGQAMI